MVSYARRKAKGSDAERELVHLLWNHGWSAARIAGSGSIKHPAPDIIAGRKGKLWVIECKTVEDLPKYFSLKEIRELEEFASRMGATPMVAVKVARKGWFILDSRKLRKTSKAVVMDYSINGIKNIEEVI
ncbi:Holliday junction resolvase [Candidatus Woesearchaeota archaeon]|nr:Holliday junction resolvase [Candidatus Woesearchaeota archaeon]